MKKQPEAQAIEASVSYFKSLGLNEDAIQRLLKNNVNDALIAQIRIEDYQEILGLSQKQVVKMVSTTPNILKLEVIGKKTSAIENKLVQLQELFKTNKKEIVDLVYKNPSLLGADIMGDNETSLKSKIKKFAEVLKCSEEESMHIFKTFRMFAIETSNSKMTSLQNRIKSLATLLKTDEDGIIKLIRQVPVIMRVEVSGDRPTSVQNKFKDMQAIFQVDGQTMLKIIKRSPGLLILDAIGETPTSIKGKMKAYQEILKLNHQELREMIINSPILLSYDIAEENSAMRCKINGMLKVVPLEELRTYVIKNPLILSAPANKFKLRYMMAKNMDIEAAFWRSGVLSTANKVWARYNFITRNHPTVIKRTQVYIGEKEFQKRLGASTEDLMQQYPLDLAAVHKVEQEYQAKTGIDCRLDTEELQVLDLNNETNTREKK